MDKVADIVNRITRLFPNLHTELRKAHIKDRPEQFVKKMLKGSATYAVMLMVLMFFVFQLVSGNAECGCKVSSCDTGACTTDALHKLCACSEAQCSQLTDTCEKMNKLKLALYSILTLPVFFVLLFLLLIKSPVTKIGRRRRDLNREVLFAGRFLLVKIHSGRPLLNALVDASQSYGIASKYFKELVDDINMGTALETALDNAMKYSPSQKYRKILFQISNAIKIGIDVSEPLSNTLDEISEEQMLEIKRYGKKLNSLSIFYMLVAVVMPSIGVAMFSVVGSLLGLGGNLARLVFFIVAGLLIIMQFMFIAIFKNARLTVNL